jgi:hypothetical protein
MPAFKTGGRIDSIPSVGDDAVVPWEANRFPYKSIL